MNPSTETSGKPADIPQDVWDAAERIADANEPSTETLARTILAAKAEERQGAIGTIETLIESLNEGLMTDAGLTQADRDAMTHQIMALHVAVDAIRKRGEA